MVTNENKPISFSDSWEVQRERLKEKFDVLTDEDLSYAEGGAISMLNNVQEKLGISREEFVSILQTI